MKVVRRVCFIGAYIVLSFTSSRAQKSVIDSLQHFLITAKEDSNKVNALLTLAIRSVNEHSEALIDEASKLSVKLNFERGRLHSIIASGNLSETKSDYESALSCYSKAIELAEKLNDTREIFSIYGQYYNAALVLGNYPKALQLALKGLERAEKLNNKKLIANYCNLVACVHLNQNNFALAKEYFSKYLVLAEELGNRSTLANAYLNMVAVAEGEKNSGQALIYLQKALNTFKILDVEKTKEKAQNNSAKERMAFTYNAISAHYKESKDYPKALEYSEKCLETCFYVMGGAYKKKPGLGINEYDLSAYYINNGEIYTQLGDFKKAEPAILLGLSIAADITDKEDMKSAYEALSELYDVKKDFKNAFQYHKKYSDMKDSILNEKSSRMAAEMSSRFESQEKDKELIKKDAEIQKQELESRHQSVLRNVLIVGFILVGFLALFVWRSYQLKKKANIAISFQKELIETKNKEITDSINYAERIQRSFLATKQLLDENLKDYFVFFKPKDIVSGDFYWASKLSNGTFALVTADSTGHGVPGAIMSILNITCLENAVKEGVTAPAEILNHTRINIIDRLRRDGSEQGGKDGMDASFIGFDFQNNKLTYAGSNNPIWIVRGSKILEFAADKMPVGKHDKDHISFTQQTIELEKSDIVYTLTDGMPDQFGGSKGKKFMYKKLKELLIEIAHLPMQEQRDVLATVLDDWKGNLEQVDDILMIGIRV